MKNNILSVLLILLLPFVYLYPVAADEFAERPDFNIEIVKHSEQVNENVGYFHLLSTADYSNNPLYIKVLNNTDIDQEYELIFNMARTNMNGAIVYDNKSAGPNNSLKYNIEELINISNPKITVPAFDEGLFEVNLDCSNVDSIEGILMGAFSVHQTKPEVRDDKAEGLRHVFSYEVGLVITDDPEGGLPNSERLDILSVETKLVEDHKAIVFEIANLEANIARNLEVEAKLLGSDSDDVVLEKTFQDFSIAPNGVLIQYLDWGRKDVVAGDYVINIEASDSINTWEWSESINISEELANQLNEESGYKVELPKRIVSVLLVLTIITIILHAKLKNIVKEMEGDDYEEN